MDVIIPGITTQELIQEAKAQKGKAPSFKLQENLITNGRSFISPQKRHRKTVSVSNAKSLKKSSNELE